MQLFSWLSKRMTGRPQNRRAPACRPVPRFRPQLEALEERWALSTLTVLNTADSGAGSLRDTIAVAHSGDKINFAPAIFGQAITLTSGELVIDKSLDVEGPSSGKDLGLGQSNRIGIFNWSSRVFDVTNSSASVVLTNLWITGGVLEQTDVGGAVLNQGANLSLLGCIVDGSANGSATGVNAQGGCIDSTGGTLTITGSYLNGNASVARSAVNVDVRGGCVFIAGGTANITNTELFGFAVNAGGGQALGGAIYLATGSLTVTGCTFGEGFTGASVLSDAGFAAGGAIYQAAGSVAVDNCSFPGDTAEGVLDTTGRGASAGGAIYSAAGDLAINNTTFFYDGFSADLSNGPSAGAGGAIYKASGTLELQNTAFQFCAAFDGGAVYLAGGTATIANCDFSANDSSAYSFPNTTVPSGGAIYVAGGSLAITNCTFADNGIDPNNGAFTVVGTAIDITGGSVCISGNTFTGADALSTAEVSGPYTLC